MSISGGFLWKSGSIWLGLAAIVTLMWRRFLLLFWAGMGGVVLSSALFWHVGDLQASASDIKINEFLPNPIGDVDDSDEFIELINTGVDEVDIGGLKLDDAAGGSTPFAIPTGTKLAAGAVAAFFSSQTHIGLNNSGGDSVRILDSAGTTVLFSVTYPTPKEGKSYSRVADDNFTENDPTPGQPNAGAPINQPPVAAITGSTSGLTGAALAFSGSGSSDAEGGVLAYAWNFGDGSSAGSGVSVSHAYVAAGNFTVTLTVTDAEGLSNVATASVNISAPVFSLAVVVNEFLPDPVGADAGNEFVELLNIGDVAVDLTGWKIDDVEGNSSNPIGIAGGTVIAPQGFFVFRSTSLTLNNDIDSVRLLAPDGSVKSQTSYTSTTEGQSHNRKDDGSFVLSATLTPGAANIFTGVVLEVEKETVYPDGIVVNEFLPNPEGIDSDLEFIEIKNTSRDAIDIGGWKLDDGEGGSSGFTISAGKILGAGAIIYFFSSQTKISLGNTNDTVRVLDPAGNVKSSFSYSKSHEGVSYARNDSGEFVETTTLTPGGTNVFTAIEEKSSSSSNSSSSSSKSSSGGKVEATSIAFVSLDKVKDLKDGTPVVTEGIVSAPPNSLGKNILYLSGSGIQVYSSKGFGVFVIGDRLRITGKMSTSGGERRILVSAKTDVVKVSVGEVPQAHELKTGEVTEPYEGSLVSVAGPVTKSSGDTFYINDGSGEVRIFIRDITGIVKPRLTKGTFVTVTGIVSQTKAGYRIMPRTQDDIFFGVKPKVSSGGITKKSSGSSSKKRADTLVCPPAVLETSAPEKICAPQTISTPSFLLSNSLVFLGCMVAMALLLMGVKAGEPLLALTPKAL